MIFILNCLLLITIPGYLIHNTHNQIPMTVYVCTLWQLLSHNTCLLLLQNQVIFVRHFNDTVVWTSTSQVRSKSLSSIITADLYVIAVSEHSAESYGFSLGTSVLLTGGVGINTVKEVKNCAKYYIA